MFAGKKSAQIREILISESAWEEMTCLFAPSLAKFIQVGATYYFNKNFNVWADYYINLLDKDTDYAQTVGGLNGNDDMAAVGVTYQF